jgi:hypothetical protein
MINVLSACLPGRCVTLTQHHESTAGKGDMLKRAAGQTIYQENHMIKFNKMALTTLAMGALLVTLSGCQKEEGPAEQAGKKLDQTTEKVGAQVEKAGESIQDTAKGDKD